MHVQVYYVLKLLRNMADEIDTIISQQPTTVNVIHREQRSSSSSTSSSHDSSRMHRRNGIGNRRSSSSSGSARYIPHEPTNVIRAGPMVTRRGGTMSMDEGQIGSIAGTSQQQQRVHGRQLSESRFSYSIFDAYLNYILNFSRHLIAFMQRICQGAADNPEFRARVMAPPARIIGRQSRLRASDVGAVMGGGSEGNAMAIASANTPSRNEPFLKFISKKNIGSPSMNTVRLLNDLQMNRTLPPPFLFNFSRSDPERSRLKYCYRLKIPRWLGWWPFAGTAKHSVLESGEEKPQREFKLKVFPLLQ